MNMNPIENALQQVNNISLTVNAEEMEEISRAVMLAPKMTADEADTFLQEIGTRGIESVKQEMGEKQFLIKCFRAAAYHQKTDLIKSQLN